MKKFAYLPVGFYWAFDGEEWMPVQVIQDYWPYRSNVWIFGGEYEKDIVDFWFDDEPQIITHGNDAGA